MFGMNDYDDLPPRTPEELEQDLKTFEESVRGIEKDFPELMLARKVAKWRWLIEQHESLHVIQ